MNNLRKMQDILAKLREAKEAKGLSYQDIVDITEQNKEYVSLSTVKRIFAKDADVSDFRYNQTIRPIVRAVLGLDEDTEAPSDVPDQKQAEQYYTTIEAMKAVLDFKHEQLMERSAEIDRLRAEIKALTDRYQREIEELKIDSNKKVEHLKDQIAYLRNVNDRNAQVIDKLLAK